jgi:hypothetical protein
MDILDSKHKKDIKKAWINHFSGKVYSKENAVKVNIALLCAPCNGFGDVMFAIKLRNFILSEYKCDVDIITTDAAAFEKMGVDALVINLSSKSGNKQCRKFNSLEFPGGGDEVGFFHLIFVGPVPESSEPSVNDLHSLFPYATKLNTYFFSEYNPTYPKDFDFPTGIGKDMMGLLLTNPVISDIPFFDGPDPYPYALMYIADIEGSSYKCAKNFLEFILAKYRKEGHFTVIMPEWLARLMENDLDDIVRKDFGVIAILYKEGLQVIRDTGKGNHLYIEADILPVSNENMLNLIKYSVRDILLTGDQSITDMFSCCYDKNLFYQTVEWKKGLAKNLSKALPNRYLANVKTSCGSIRAIRYNSDYKEFVDHWDFRKLAKSKLDAVMIGAGDVKDGVALPLYELFNSRNGIRYIQKQVGNTIREGYEISYPGDEKGATFNNFFEEIFIINLYDKLDRFGKVTAQFQEQGIKYDRFVAIDGRCGTADLCKKKKRHIFKEYGIKVSPKFHPAAASLVVGHILMLRAQIENGWKSMLICEDDIVFEPDMQERMAKSIPTLDGLDWDVLYLGCGGACSDKGISWEKTETNKYLTSWSIVNSNEEEFYVSHPDDLRFPCSVEDCPRVSEELSIPASPGGAWALAYSLEGAKKILAGLPKNINDHIDQYLPKMVQRGELNAYTFNVPILNHMTGALRPDTDINWS